MGWKLGMGNCCFSLFGSEWMLSNSTKTKRKLWIKLKMAHFWQDIFGPHQRCFWTTSSPTVLFIILCLSPPATSLSLSPFIFFYPQTFPSFQPKTQWKIQIFFILSNIFIFPLLFLLETAKFIPKEKNIQRVNTYRWPN